MCLERSSCLFMVWERGDSKVSVVVTGDSRSPPHPVFLSFPGPGEVIAPHPTGSAAGNYGDEEAGEQLSGKVHQSHPVISSSMVCFVLLEGLISFLNTFRCDLPVGRCVLGCFGVCSPGRIAGMGERIRSVVLGRHANYK